jgi:hypothetical protein
VRRTSARMDSDGSARVAKVTYAYYRKSCTGGSGAKRFSDASVLSSTGYRWRRGSAGFERRLSLAAAVVDWTRGGFVGCWFMAVISRPAQLPETQPRKSDAIWSICRAGVRCHYFSSRHRGSTGVDTVDINEAFLDNSFVRSAGPGPRRDLPIGTGSRAFRASAVGRDRQQRTGKFTGRIQSYKFGHPHYSAALAHVTNLSAGGLRDREDSCKSSAKFGGGVRDMGTDSADGLEQAECSRTAAAQ